MGNVEHELCRVTVIVQFRNFTQAQMWCEKMVEASWTFGVILIALFAWFLSWLTNV